MNHKLGFIGLGRMGKNMVLRLGEQGVDVVAFNRTTDKTLELVKETMHVTAAATPKELVALIPAPRVIWMMVPNGQPIDEVISALVEAGLSKGDVLIDGGNTYYKDSVRRHAELSGKGIRYIDCGTSGGLEGARTGACLMLGGEKEDIQSLTWLWDALAVKGGWAHFGPAGAGHFVKMVHNGVEYGMNQALGEGFEILAKGPYSLDFAKVAHTWSRGSVVRSWLVELLAAAFDADPKLDGYTGKVGGGETGKWTLEAAREFGVEASVIEKSAEAREKSQAEPTFAGKVVSALRAGYGGHKEPK